MEVIIAAPVPTAVPKKILIYHSHTYEAYTQVADAPYVETEKWRTKDATANVVAVGRALAAALTAMGHEVTHDETAFEPPELSSAYVRSLEMLEARRSAGEQYDLYIDLHRDAFDSPDAIKRVVNIGGENVALAHIQHQKTQIDHSRNNIDCKLHAITPNQNRMP